MKGSSSNKRAPRLRSEVKYVEDNLVSESNSSLTYASLTLGSMINVLHTFIEYGMNEDSVICDIGSGIGNFVFTSAILFNKRSLGIEIV